MTKKLSVRELCIFAMLGTLMFLSKLVMEALPNIHLVGMLTVTYTVAFRKRALVPIYVFVLLSGIYAGFSLWWVPYIYIWSVLWAVVMLIPKKISKTTAALVYMAVCGLHGLCFGLLYAPMQALLFGLNFNETIAWIVAGFPFDLTHAVGNTIAGSLIVPLSALLVKLDKKHI